MKNGDLMREMSNEKLAVALKCPNYTGLTGGDCKRHFHRGCHNCKLEWLNREASEQDVNKTGEGD